MQSDFLDRKLYKMAEQEQMAVPEDLDARVDDILWNLEKKDRGSRHHHYSFRRAAILAAACLVLASATVTASGLYQARMESMNHEKLEEYFAQLQEANVSADTYSRPMTESETTRLEELRQAYLEQGYFPNKELTLIDSPEKYKKGVAFYAERSTFFLPEKELTDEQLLELIDFKEKREYSLAKISEEIEAGSYEYVKTEPEKDAAQQGHTAQQGTSGTVLGADTATQEWQIAYEGDVSIRCAAVAENGLYVGGFTTEGQARVEYLPYGSGTPETIFEDFAENGEVYSLCTTPDGSIYAGLKGLAAAGAEHGWLPEIYHISPEGTLLNSFTVGEREWNIVDSMATDAQGRLYARMRMQEDGSYVRIYSAEGELIGTVADDSSYAVKGAGALGQGKDGKVYAAALAVGDMTAGDETMTLVSVDPEGLRFVPVAGNVNATESTGTIYRWDMVAASVSETADFILWGYNGVDIYRLGETEFTRVQESWEMPCGTEGTCAVLVPDGRILYIGASGGFRGNTADGVEISGKDPAQTVFYYEPLELSEQ
ncbi:MAG: hypothetical protein J6B69_02585 [Lachnospiraceae bacterium]|nr:hypothetical protein [Lachnospiraceae bacterium]